MQFVRLFSNYFDNEVPYSYVKYITSIKEIGRRDLRIEISEWRAIYSVLNFSITKIGLFHFDHGNLRQILN